MKNVFSKQVSVPFYFQTNKLACASVVSHGRTIPQNAHAKTNSPFGVSSPYDAGMYEPYVMQ